MMGMQNLFLYWQWCQCRFTFRVAVSYLKLNGWWNRIKNAPVNSTFDNLASWRLISVPKQIQFLLCCINIDYVLKIGSSCLVRAQASYKTMRWMTNSWSAVSLTQQYIQIKQRGCVYEQKPRYGPSRVRFFCPKYGPSGIWNYEQGELWNLGGVFDGWPTRFRGVHNRGKIHEKSTGAGWGHSTVSASREVMEYYLL